MPRREYRKDYGDSAMGAAFVSALCYSCRDLIPVLAGHNAYYDSVIPHIFMADDVMKWVVAHRDETAKIQPVLDWVEEAYLQAEREKNDDILEVIVLSGIECIPMPGEPGHEIRWLLGEGLSKEADAWFSRFEQGKVD